MKNLNPLKILAIIAEAFFIFAAIVLAISREGGGAIVAMLMAIYVQGHRGKL